MAAGTLIVGLAPDYASIGLAAPLLIVLARVIQGLSVGGEFASAAAMLVELAPPGRKMFYGSFQMASQGMALLVASGISLLLTEAMAPAALEAWGWRIPFLLGSLIVRWVSTSAANAPRVRSFLAVAGGWPDRCR